MNPVDVMAWILVIIIGVMALFSVVMLVLAAISDYRR